MSDPMSVVVALLVAVAVLDVLAIRGLYRREAERDARIRALARHEAREECKALSVVYGRRFEQLERRTGGHPYVRPPGLDEPTLRLADLDEEVG